MFKERRRWREAPEIPGMLSAKWSPNCIIYCPFNVPFLYFSLSSFQPREPPSTLSKPGLVAKGRRFWSRQSGWLRWGTTIQRGWLLHRGIWRREKSTSWRKGPFFIGNFCLSLCYEAISYLKRKVMVMEKNMKHLRHTALTGNFSIKGFFKVVLFASYEYWYRVFVGTLANPPIFILTENRYIFFEGGGGTKMTLSRLV